MCTLPEDARVNVNPSADISGADGVEKTPAPENKKSASVSGASAEDSAVKRGGTGETAAEEKPDRFAKPGKKTLRMWIGFVIMAAVVLLDFITKQLTVHVLGRGGDFPIIKGVLHLTYVENTGAAFGILRDNRWVFMAVSSVAIVAMLVFMILFRKRINRPYGVALSLIIGGGIGNMIDRIALGYVIDMINFELINFAVFNVADSAVCIGAALLLIYAIFFDREDVSEDVGKRNKRRNKA